MGSGASATGVWSGGSRDAGAGDGDTILVVNATWAGAWGGAGARGGEARPRWLVLARRA